MLQHFVEEVHKWMWRAATVEDRGDSGQYSGLQFPSPHEFAAMELGLLASHRDCIEPKFLHRLMADDPAAFVEVVSIAFTPDETPADGTADAPGVDNEPANTTESGADDASGHPLSARLRSSPGLAFNVVRTWRTAPGSHHDGTIDTVVLTAWIDNARQLLAVHRRLDIGDEYIGHALAGAPAGDDGIRIPRAVRDALEHCSSKHVNAGLQIALSNDETGGAVRVTESAVTECETAAAQFSDQAVLVADRWPRSAHVLRGLAEGSRAQARWYREILNDRT